MPHSRDGGVHQVHERHVARAGGQVVDALVKADKDFEFVLLPTAGHGAAESPYGNRRRVDFLVRKLLDEG